MLYRIKSTSANITLHHSPAVWKWILHLRWYLVNINTPTRSMSHFNSTSMKHMTTYDDRWLMTVCTFNKWSTLVWQIQWTETRIRILFQSISRTRNCLFLRQSDKEMKCVNMTLVGEFSVAQDTNKCIGPTHHRSYQAIRLRRKMVAIWPIFGIFMHQDFVCKNLASLV